MINLLTKYKVPFAIVGLLGSLAGVIFSLFDLDKAVKEKKNGS